MLASPYKSLAAAAVVTAVVLVAFFSAQVMDVRGLAAFLLRALHVVSAVVWVGFIWFVNAVQLPAFAAVQYPERAILVRHVLPRVAVNFHMAAHLTVGSGLVLLVTGASAALGAVNGRALALWLAIAGGLAMWAIVQFGIMPRVAVLTGPTEQPQEVRAKTANGIRILARINLVLALPVIVTMIAAAHFH